MRTENFKNYGKNQNREYYYIDRILKLDADINIIPGERAGGKTHALKCHCLLKYLYSNTKTVFCRRYGDDITSALCTDYFGDLVTNEMVFDSEEDFKNKLFGEDYVLPGNFKITSYKFGTPTTIIKLLSNGKFNNIKVVSKRVYLCFTPDESEDELVDANNCFYMKALSQGKHARGGATDDVMDFVFDEFLAEDGKYLSNEIILYNNLLSTIFRRDVKNKKVWLLGNTYDRNNIYFEEYDILTSRGRIKSASRIEDGELWLYTFKELERKQELKIALELAVSDTFIKETNKLFLNSKSSNTIVGSGDVWVHGKFKTLPEDYEMEMVIKYFYIIYGDYVIKGNVINSKVYGSRILYFEDVESKEIPYNDLKKCLIFTSGDLLYKNYIQYITVIQHVLQQEIANIFKSNFVFYENESIGDIVKGYIRYSKANMNM